ncbi:hypothetical protein [Myxococcus landrumensis]|uniref:Uncharacterized protein n=1 Tax=Myxococcus landrumensis TaxID=2813577 RepID=A0ABX7NCL4_9BACT|nr:hypothetical protein [Myxococcus landrumus]QSQ14048.1 hypothetical protein JY572_38000 [Myxococcus landrumus]
MAGVADESWVQLAEAQQSGRHSELDNRLNVTFGLHPHKDEEASAKAGHPIFGERVYIRIITPGDNKNIIHRPAWDGDFRRFRRQYEDFRAGQAEGVSGMPLKEWPQVTRSEVEMLAHFKVRTVEDLAGLSDGAISDIGYPIRHIVTKAQAFISAAKEQAPQQRMAEALKAKEAEMEAMRQQLKKQGEQLEQLAKQQQRK